MSRAQDKKREEQQLERLKLEATPRGEKADAFYRMHIDCKTRRYGTEQTTKREYGNKRGDKYDPADPIDDPFDGVVLYVNQYVDAEQVLDEGAHLVFPEALKEWTEFQQQKLLEGDGYLPTHAEVDTLMSHVHWDVSDEEKEEIYAIEKKFRQSVFLNDPYIHHKFFDSDGEYHIINRRQAPTQYPEWCIRLSDNWDHSTEVRDWIDKYLEWKAQQNEV